MLGRPYHNDPGLNHSVLEEFQALGYPILSMRSLPRDKAEMLDTLFAEDIAKGVIENGLDVTDVWPENYSTNSVQKVWAAKYAARHPNVACLDLSSFKCGHDAPTYGLIDSIIALGRQGVLGAPRHRREQAERLDQDPRQDVRAHADAPQGEARGSGDEEGRARSRARREEARADGALQQQARGASVAPTTSSIARSQTLADAGRRVAGAGRRKPNKPEGASAPRPSTSMRTVSAEIDEETP